MTEEYLKKRYFNWMVRTVCAMQNSKKLSYKKLLNYLYHKEFFYLVELDANRYADGIDLRYRFGYENNYDRAAIACLLDNEVCSVLEMMVSLAIRCEEHIMDDPDIGDRTGKWFWDMVDSLGLEGMNDENYDQDTVDTIIERFLNRKYKRNGSGSLFTVHQTTCDMRNEEIWYQMMRYLNETIYIK